MIFLYKIKFELKFFKGDFYFYEDIILLKILKEK